MLTLRDGWGGANMQITVAPGTVIGVGFVLPPAAGPFTCNACSSSAICYVGYPRISTRSRSWPPSSRGIIR